MTSQLDLSNLAEIPQKGDATAPPPSPKQPAVSQPPAKEPETVIDIPTDITDGKNTAPNPEAHEIPTDITGDEPPRPATEKPKTSAEFAEERRKAKRKQMEEELGVPKMREELTAAQQEQARLLAEEQKFHVEREKLTKEVESLREEARVMRERAETATTGYGERFETIVSPMDDPEYRQSAEAMHSIFVNGLPDTIQSQGKRKVIVPEAIFRDPQRAKAAGKIIGDYARARTEGDVESMTRTINQMAELMGADVIVSDNPAEEVLLDTASEEFRKISEAMKAAAPHYAKLGERASYVATEAPKIYETQLRARADAVRTNMLGRILIQRDEALAKLEQEPTNATALIALLGEQIPGLKQLVEQEAVSLAPLFARVQPPSPPLFSKDDKAISQHREQQARMNSDMITAMDHAVVGRVAGHLISALWGQLSAASKRADAAAAATSPGSAHDRGDGGEKAMTIPTEI